ncbi:MAG: YadA-like family protein [Candidatus Omnitrophica bacterium]|nr:YadA-like family protein [Candidatus Omnitrophota bacterium]
MAQNKFGKMCVALIAVLAFAAQGSQAWAAAALYGVVDTTLSKVDSNNSVLIQADANANDLAGEDSHITLQFAGTSLMDLNGKTMTTTISTNVDATSGLDVTGGNLTLGGNDITGVNSITATSITGTLQTAAQTGITSVGTLSSLAVSGAETVGTTLGVGGNLSVATNKFTVNATNGNTVVAGTLNAGASTLTSVGVTGAETVGTTLDVTGNTTLSTLSTSGLASLNAGVTVTGATNVNVNTNSVTNINTGTSNATVTIGNSANTTNLNSGVNNIGTIGGDAVTIGNTTGTTAITGQALNINTGANALVTTIGSSTVTAGSVTMQSVGNKVVVSSTGTAVTGSESVSGNFSANGATNNIGTTQASANNIGTFGTSTTAIGNTTGTTGITGSTVAIIGQSGNSMTATTGNNAFLASTGNNTMTSTLGANTITGVTNTITESGNSNSVAVNSTGTTIKNAAGTDKIEVLTTAVTSPSIGTDASGAPNPTFTYGTKVTGGMYVDGSLGVNGNIYTLNPTANASVMVGNNGLKIDGSQNSANLTVQNTVTGSTEGVRIQQTQTVLSGGTHSTSLTLDDTGATFHSSTSENGTAKVTGVADATSDYDAVNYKQFKDMSTKAYAGVASVAALAAIPAPVAGKDFAIGGGVGNYQGQSACAIGFKKVIGKKKDVMITAGMSYANDRVAATNAGMSWSF